MIDQQVSWWFLRSLRTKYKNKTNLSDKMDSCVAKICYDLFERPPSWLLFVYRSPRPLLRMEMCRHILAEPLFWLCWVTWFPQRPHANQMTARL